MKILHITDSHGTVKSPEGRKDIYYVSFLKKFYELGYVIKKHNIDMVIHTGDLFHTARVSDKFTGQVASLIKAFGVPMYVVPGNHDIEGYTVDTIDQTKLGLLAKTETLTILDREKPLFVTAKQGDEEFTIAISGQEYYAHIDEGNTADFDMRQEEADFNILAIHSYITPVDLHPSIKYTLANTITTDADVILAGHFHQQYEYNGVDFNVYNPGSLMRVDQTEYNKTHTPQYGILDITLNEQDELEYSYQFYKLAVAQPSSVVFDYNSKYQQKETSITLDGFKNSISNSMSSFSNSISTNIVQIIDEICHNARIDQKIRDLSVDAYNDTLQTAPEDYEVQTGFIESPVTKQIESIEINNFQSHKHSIIPFSKGLNVFIGESNSGKTGILRAILWVIDNQPLGTDFITAGEDECSVKILYTDGTYIKRSRTQKDTGTYEIKTLDESGNFKEETYRGFTNAVPVEVANVHQMPKINITKDLETHLNVITQLEGPFLLTESPNTKAAAIGRITGTHVVDKAIKDKSSEILSNKKFIKSLNKDLEAKQAELDALPDVQLMQLFFDAYHQLFEKAKELTEFIDTSKSMMQDIVQNNHAIAVQRTLCHEQKIIAQTGSIVKEAKRQLEYLNSIKDLYSKYQINLQDVELQKQDNHNNKIIASLKGIVSFSVNQKKDFDTISSLYQKYLSGAKMQEETEDRIKNYTEYKNLLKTVISRGKFLFSFVSKAEPMFQEIQIKKEQEKSIREIIENSKKALESISSEIAETKEQRNSAVLDNQICPCCGQSINDSHVDSIVNFMKTKE